jgi:hypothetical protein
MTWKEIRKGESYNRIEVTAIYLADSSWAGPGLDKPQNSDDIIVYRDYANADWSSCPAKKFAHKVRRNG